MVGVGDRRRWHTLIDKDELSTTGEHTFLYMILFEKLQQARYDNPGHMDV